jgi:hypothetical protein
VPKPARARADRERSGCDRRNVHVLLAIADGTTVATAQRSDSNDDRLDVALAIEAHVLSVRAGGGVKSPKPQPTATSQAVLPINWRYL